MTKIRRRRISELGEVSRERITGTTAIPSFTAALIRRWPSTTSPSLRANTGILKPTSRMLVHMRSTVVLARISDVRNQPFNSPDLYLELLLRFSHLGSPGQAPPGG